MEKLILFGSFVTIMVMAFTTLLLARAVVLTAVGANSVRDNVDPVRLGMAADIPYMAGVLVAGALLARFVFGRERMRMGWERGKGLVAPLIVIGVVLGSIKKVQRGLPKPRRWGLSRCFSKMEPRYQ